MTIDTAHQPILSAEQREQFIQDGYVRVSGLIPSEVVAAARAGVLDALHIRPEDPETWAGKAFSHDPAALSCTEACRTPGIEAVAAGLLGPGFVPGLAYSPYLEARGVTPSDLRGFIPVLNFPSPGPLVFEPPTAGYHIDGMDAVTVWPGKFFLVVFAYLTDTAEYGGATTVRPGSHRQVFEHWLATGDKGNTTPPALEYDAPFPCRVKRAM